MLLVRAFRRYVELKFRYLMLDRISAPLGHLLKGFYEIVPLEDLTSAGLDAGDLELILLGNAEARRLLALRLSRWVSLASARCSHADPRHSRRRAQIEIADWRAHHQSDCSDQINEWFWRLVDELDNEQRAKLLQFATSTSRLPFGGFAELQGRDGKICLFELKKKAAFRDDMLPRSHTCLNRIDMPQYTSYEKMKTTFVNIITHSVAGFGME